MAVDPGLLKDPAQVRSLMVNAAKAGSEDLVFRCQIRLAELEGSKYSDAVQREFWTAISVAEELATRKNGRTTRLNRTRQKIARVGERRCVADLAGSPKITQGFEILVRGGRPDLTAEAIVIRHSDEFDAEVVVAASAKLRTYRVDLASLQRR